MTLNTSYDSGFRYYDTAPWYGHGLSEHRIGSLLRNKLREEYIQVEFINYSKKIIKI